MWKLVDPSNKQQRTQIHELDATKNQTRQELTNPGTENKLTVSESFPPRLSFLSPFRLSAAFVSETVPLRSLLSTDKQTSRKTR